MEMSSDKAGSGGPFEITWGKSINSLAQLGPHALGSCSRTFGCEVCHGLVLSSSLYFSKRPI
eukprot:5867716-Pyramimonas_sp.AAC.1